ncbi:glycoside hydrolase family 43 protein [Olivibacter sitiensis]|uniref:glycoside hydrolase family 43 protein n=1 Tax=Olivibacter sitiensis TaxID=376470 RepID=UPI000688909F|nr:glycoside hydrolase family 43 protein [Olivibacter sitiensis]
MNRWFFLVIWLGFSLFGCSGERAELSHNPLDVAFGDPFILYDEDTDRYYMYGTGGIENGFMAYVSDDLRKWEPQGTVYTSKQEKAWGTKDFWAPEVYKREGKYYMFYSAHWKENPNNELENYRIGVAVSDSPTGPFIDMTGTPLFDPGYPIIDANVYFGEDDKLYLYYSRCCYKNPVESEIADWARKKGLYDEIEESWVYGVELASDFSSVIGEPQLLLRPPLSMDDKQAEWESRSVTSGEVNRRWTEGSYLFKHDGLYYMMYSANHFAGENYAVGYATSSDPLGPFEKSVANPVLQKNKHEGGVVSGTGHNSILKDRDGKVWCVYHARTDRTGNERMVFLDKMEILPNGQLVIHGPTVKPQ